jgi:hypothetical protein
MRWPWTRGEAPDPAAEVLRGAVDAIDTVDIEGLEIVELDAAGRLVGPAAGRAHPAPREVADRPPRRDPTGTAGLWEALAHS